MSDERTPVDGPFRIHVDPIPAGARLDLSHWLGSVLLNLAAAAEEDGEGLLDELVALSELARSASVQGIDSHAAHERDDRLTALMLMVADDGCVPVYGGQVLRLAERLRRVGMPKAIPGQREDGAA